ncbi:hypothetical protein N9C96_01920 [bacterium]|nr:hypothetical protein [bacterium]
MAHPLHTLAGKLEKLTAERKSRHAMHAAIADPHLARDVGLPHKPRHIPRVDRW